MAVLKTHQIVEMALDLMFHSVLSLEKLRLSYVYPGKMYRNYWSLVWAFVARLVLFPVAK